MRAAADSVVRVTGTACGSGVEGSGWVAAPGLVVTNAHVVAGQEDTEVSVGERRQEHDATPVHYDPPTTSRCCGSTGSAAIRCRSSASPASGTPGAVLGYPENGPFTITPARLGATETVISEDSYGRGPIRRELTSFRGEVPQRQLGGPMLDGGRAGADDRVRLDEHGQARRLRRAQRDRRGCARRLVGRGRHRALHVAPAPERTVPGFRRLPLVSCGR